MSENAKKIVVVLNEKIETGKAMNALAHAMLGFGAGVVSREDVKLNEYIDADGNIHDNISEMAIVVLKAKSQHIRTLRTECIAHSMRFVAFTESMSIGTYYEEYELTKTIPESKLNYFAIIIMGDHGIVSEITRKLSLYR